MTMYMHLLFTTLLLGDLSGTSDMQGAVPISWPMVGHDARHTFRTVLPGPREATLAWTFTVPLEEVINSGTVVDARGRVFFGTWGRYMSSDFTSVACARDGAAFLVGSTAYLGGSAVSFRLGSAAWERIECPAQVDLNSVDISDSRQGWAVGDDGTIVQLTAAGWLTVNGTPAETDLLSVDVGPDGDAWAVGEVGTILRYDGVAWQSVASPTAVALQDVDLDPQRTWGLACGGFWYVNLIELVEGNWQLVSTASFGLRGTLDAVEVMDTGSAWVIGGYQGADGWVTEFAHLDAGDWTVYTVDQGPRLHALEFTSAEEGWAVGDDGAGAGVVWRYEDGAGWFAWEQELDVEPLRSIGSSAASGIWAVGDKATIMTFDGARWSGVQQDLYTHNSTDGRFFCVERNGDPGWSVDPGYVMGDGDQARAGTVESTAAIDWRRRQIYFGRGDGVVRAVDLDTGQERWSLDTNAGESGLRQYSQVVGGITLDGDGILHFVSCFPRLAFYSVRPDGRLLGSYEVGDRREIVIGAPAVREDDSGRMLLIAAGNRLYVFDGFASAENLLWSYRAAAAENLVMPTISDDGRRVYVDSQWRGDRGRVHAIDLEERDAAWVFTVQEEIAGVVSLGQPDRGGYLYIGSDTGDGDGWPHLYVLEDLGSSFGFPFGEQASVLEFPGSAAVASPLVDGRGDLFVVAGGRADRPADGPAVILALQADLTPLLTPQGTPFEVYLDRPIMGLASLALGPRGRLFIGDAACPTHDCADATNAPTLYAIGGR